MKMATILLTACSIALLQPLAARPERPPRTPVGVAAPAGEPGCERDVIWADRERTWARFFPSRCFAGIDFSTASADDLSRLPFPEGFAREFLDLLARLRIEQNAARLRGQAPKCLLPPIATGSGASPALGSQSLADLTLNADLSIVGRVLSATPGWAPDLGGPATLVRVEVEDILHDRRGSAAVGNEVSYLQRSASFYLDGLVLCIEQTGFLEAAPGERVLLNGNHFSYVPHEGYLNLREVFPIEESTVVAQPYTHVKPGAFGSLSSLREEVARKAQEHE